MAPGARRGLTVRVGTDLRALADDLADGLARPTGPVLEQELVVVPTPGVGAWLQPLLAARLGAGPRADGICANVSFRLAGELLRRMDRDRDHERDEWSVEAMTIASLGILLDADGELAHLHGPDDERTGFSVARAASDLFDQLFRWRPDVADRWLAGDDEDRRAALLRRLAARASTAPPHVALAAAVTRLAAGDDAGLDLAQVCISAKQGLGHLTRGLRGRWRGVRATAERAGFLSVESRG